MKNLFLALLLFPLSAGAMTVENAELVRVLDGSSYNCQETWEAGKTGYTPVIGSITDDGKLTVSLGASFAACVRDGDVVHWAPRTPLDPTYTRDADGNTVRIEYRNPELTLNNAAFTHQVIAPLSNESPQVVTFGAIRNEDFLSARQLADLNAGKPVAVRLTLVERSIGTAFNARGDQTPLGYQFGGSYTLLFTLKK